MHTPLKILLAFTLLISLVALFVPALSEYLLLSSRGIKKLYLWQFFSYPLLEKGPFSFSFVFSLALNLYLLWAFGSSLIERIGDKIFFLLYFSAPLISSLGVFLFPHLFLAGPSVCLFAVLFCWMMLNRYSQLFLFFALPFKSYLLLSSFFAISIGIEILQGDFASALALLLSCLYTYFFTLTLFKSHSPYPLLKSFESKFFRFLEKKKTSREHKSKIYDIQSGSPISDDDRFMDAMLEKISRHGEESLSEEEKKRMKKISKKGRP